MYLISSILIRRWIAKLHPEGRLCILWTNVLICYQLFWGPTFVLYGRLWKDWLFLPFGYMPVVPSLPLVLISFSVSQELDQDANIINVRFTKSVIASKAAFTYEEAQIHKDDP